MARLSAACKRAMSSGDGLSDVMSHDSPTSCIQAPTSDTRPAIHRARKTAWLRGRQGEMGSGAVVTG